MLCSGKSVTASSFRSPIAKLDPNPLGEPSECGKLIMIRGVTLEVEYA
jgi:hypothetical protein